MTLVKIICSIDPQIKVKIKLVSIENFQTKESFELR